jgi:hypothetical protein
VPREQGARRSEPLDWRELLLRVSGFDARVCPACSQIAVERSALPANEIGTEVVTLSFGPKAVTTRMKYLDVWKEQPDGSWLLYRRMFSSNAPQK